MMEPFIKESHVGLIEDHLRSQGFAYEPIFDDLLDHLCVAVAAKMSEGSKFVDAFEKVKTEFGKDGLERIYYQTVNNLNPFTMFRNYLISAWRNLLRQKIYTGINILGLVLGLSACATIAIYVNDELRYDKFHPDYENIYRFSARIEANGQVYDEAGSQFPMAEALASEFPGIAQTVRINIPYAVPLLRYQEKKFIEDGYIFADATFFEVFGFKLLQGDAESVLKEPNSIVLTEEAAARYFGEQDPMGKLIEFTQGADVKSLRVTGIAENVRHSHFDFDMVVPLEFQLNRWRERRGNTGAENKWYWTGAWTYARVENKEAFETIQAALPTFLQKYFPPKWKIDSSIETERVDRIHLHSNRLGEMKPNGSIAQVKIFSAIAIVILIVAVINFINLMSAQGVDRAKQVGVRKFLGALRSDIIKQFLVESVLLCLLAGGIALLLTYFVLIPQVNEVAGKALDVQYYLTPFNVSIYVLGLIALGVFAGIYPASFFSKFNALKILRGTLKHGSGSSVLRQSFVIIQFVSSVVLIVCVLVINSQRDHIQSIDTGFDKENILVVETSKATIDRLEAFKNEVRNVPGVVNICAVLDIPGRGSNSIRFVPEGKDIEQPEQLPVTYVDYDFIETASIGLAEGRFFDRSHPADINRGFVINEKAAQLLGWEGNATGKKLDMFAPGSAEIGMKGEVVGVVKDYNFESIHHPIRPLVMVLDDQLDYYLVKYKGVDLSTLTTDLEAVWSQFDQKWPMESYLMDQNLAKLYDQEEKLTRVTNYGMGFALVIAFIGIYGLSSFLISKRTKEVGVRRVLGSSTFNILTLLSRDFIKLVLIANLLAWPIAFYLMDQWLQNFQYAVELSWPIFLVATICSLTLAVAAIGYHTLKVSHADPVRSLRYE